MSSRPVIRKGGPDIDLARLQALLAERGWTAYGFSKELGLDQGYVWRIVHGQYTRMGAKFMAALMRLNIDPQSLMRDHKPTEPVV